MRTYSFNLNEISTRHNNEYVPVSYVKETDYCVHSDIEFIIMLGNSFQLNQDCVQKVYFRRKQTWTAKLESLMKFLFYLYKCGI